MTLLDPVTVRLYSHDSKKEILAAKKAGLFTENPDMAMGSDPFEVSAAQQSVVVEGEAVDAALGQRLQMDTERGLVVVAARLDNGPESGIGGEFSAHGGDAKFCDQSPDPSPRPARFVLAAQ